MRSSAAAAWRWFRIPRMRSQTRCRSGHLRQQLSICAYPVRDLAMSCRIWRGNLPCASRLQTQGRWDMTIVDIDQAEQLRIEKILLLKADSDIEDGRKRLRNQEGLLLGLKARGRDTKQAERLAELMKTTLAEWE